MPPSHGTSEPVKALLEVRDLRVALDIGAAPVHAVDGVGFEVRDGETLALVGESGCGKTLTALALLDLLPRPTARIAGGSIRWRGTELVGSGSRRLRRLRGQEIGFVFQEPQSSLNPVQRVGAQVVEAIRAHTRCPRHEAMERAVELLREVGIPDPSERVSAYPHELSGGMLQRVGIAIALAEEPALLVADEPTTALDVTVQAEVLALLSRLRAQRGMALLLITHDLALVAQTADRVAVLYGGRVVETAPVAELFAHPRHPYTHGLLESLPDRQRAGQDGELRAIPGTVPSPGSFPSGCRFRTRCPRAQERCGGEDPGLAPVTAGSRHEVACWFPVATGDTA